jgi:hypothetical protein
MAKDADLSRVPSRRPPNPSHLLNGKAPPVVLTAAAFALVGCNAGQGVDASTGARSGVAAGPYFPGYNPYDPTKYAQTSGFYSGR